jgi:hypothetical protein
MSLPALARLSLMRPEYEGVKMYLLCGDMKHYHVTPDDPNANCLLEPIDNYELY